MSLVKFGVFFAMYAQFQAQEPPTLPEVDLPPISQEGNASWYGDGTFHGQITANGEQFDPHNSYTCAHRNLPFNTVVLIENRSNGRRVWCRINDRGPYGRIDENGEWGIEVSSSYDIQWRGILDMSIATADALQTRDVGLQKIYLRYWKKPRRSRFDLAAWSP